MNKAALATSGRKLNGEDLFLMSVFDLEPAGILIHAYNQANSKELMLPVSEMELAKSGYTRKSASLLELLDTISLVNLSGEDVLDSSVACITKIKKRPTGEELNKLLNQPIVEGSESIQELLVKGLVELCKVKPVGLDAVQWIGEWLLANNPNKPRVEDPDEQ